MSYTELPMCCRQCAHRISQYLFPSWTHKCARTKPMIEHCAWRQSRPQGRGELDRKGD